MVESNSAREVISLNRDIEVEVEVEVKLSDEETETKTIIKTVANMTANIGSEKNSELKYNINVVNYDLYINNIDYVRQEIDNFILLIREKEDHIVSTYYPEIASSGVIADEPILEEEPVPE